MRFFPDKTGELLLLAHEGDHFDRKISSSGEDLLIPCHCPREGTFEGRILQSEQLSCYDNTLYIPVCCCSQPYGILTISGPGTDSFSPRELECLAAIGGELAFLSRNLAIHAEEAWRMEQLAFLSDLGRQLTQAHHFKELLSTAAKSIHRHSRAACVILRPLIGGTVMGGSHLRLSSPFRKHRALLHHLEEQHAPRALFQPTPLYLSDFIDSEQYEDGMPTQMVVVPLFFQYRMLGTLTLFFHQEMADSPFANRGMTTEFYTSVGSQIAHAMERVSTLERLESLSAENDLKLRELSLLYHCFRAIHSTLNLDELIHLILSVATVPDGGGFERAMLFTINERSGVLQGMLGVSQDSAALLLYSITDRNLLENPAVTREGREAQRMMPFCQQVMRQRLPLNTDDNALARAVRDGQVIFVTQPSAEPPAGAAFAEELQLGPYACAPLRGKNRTLGVLVMDNFVTKRAIGLDRLRFLELFAHQASSAMENSLLIQRLESVNRDLSESREQLAQGEKMAALGELAASIAHELKTPLVTIGGFAQRLHRQIEPNSKEGQYCEIIARESRRMEKILSEILAFSKKQLLCFGECHMEALFDQVLVLSGDALKKARIEVVVDLAPGLPSFQGDEQKMLQVLINLVDNARHSMSAGGTLTLRSKPDLLHGDSAIAIGVQDTGCGIPAEVQKKIFTPFFTTKDKGTGLGLGISQRIILQHRGTIDLFSNNSGTLFTIRLPLKASLEPYIF
ncbi:MAG: ATP-binding protein [Desulfuromonadaceae bacterium]